MTVESAIKDLSEGKITSRELVEASFSKIDERDSELNVFIRTFNDEALDLATASDKRRQAGTLLSALDGVPVSVKDNFSYRDHITSAGSKILENYNAPYDATAIKRLKEAGAIIIGQTNMDEFAMGSSTENSYFGVTKNPHDSARVAGGSSGGAAASVAADMVPLAYGSDTGGSIRQPAAFCGVVGLKPTYGAVSRYGLLAMASSLDQIGPMARTVQGVKVGFNAIKGFDPLDSTSVETSKVVAPKEKYTIGVPKQFTSNGLDPRIAETLETTLAQLEAEGHTIRRNIDLPILDQSVAIYYLIMPAEVSSNLARYDGIRFGLHGNSVVDSRTLGFGPEVKRRIMLGTYALSAGYADQYYKRAQAARAALTKQILGALESVDLLIGPVTPELPFQIGEKSNDPLAMYLSDIYTIPVNLSGVPAVTVPVATIKEGETDLPVSLQLIAKHWGESQLFDLGGQLERSIE